jgi:hypothetical protein
MQKWGGKGKIKEQRERGGGQLRKTESSSQSSQNTTNRLYP